MMSKAASFYAPASGILVPLKDVPDDAFSKGLLGPGVAIQPATDAVFNICAPATGTLRVLFPTGHAACVVDENDIEVMVHIGIDTVELKGSGFRKLVTQGDWVTNEQALVEVQPAEIPDTYNLLTPIIFTNRDHFTELQQLVPDGATVSVGDELFRVTIIN
jgi:glucose-specific phosphotransferase system IIA component